MNNAIIAFNISEIQSYGLSMFALSVYYSDRVEVHQFYSLQGARTCWMKMLNKQSEAA